MAISVTNGIILMQVRSQLIPIRTFFLLNPVLISFLGEVSGYTEAKLKTILTEIEACPDTTSQCSMSVSDLTAAKEGFN